MYPDRKFIYIVTLFIIKQHNAQLSIYTIFINLI